MPFGILDDPQQQAIDEYHIERDQPPLLRHFVPVLYLQLFQRPLKGNTMAFITVSYDLFLPLMLLYSAAYWITGIISTPERTNELSFKVQQAIFSL